MEVASVWITGMMLGNKFSFNENENSDVMEKLTVKIQVMRLTAMSLILINLITRYYENNYMIACKVCQKS